MSFLSKIFARSKAKPSKLRRATVSCPNGMDSSDDDHATKLAASPETVTRRRAAVDLPSADVLAQTRRTGELRRSKTYSEARVSAARSSTSSADGSGGEVLGAAYKRVKRRHCGGNATVLQAVDRQTQRLVMIKAFAKLNLPTTKREKLEREVHTLKSASGVAGVVKYLDSLEDSTHYYTILEGIPGYTLIELMANNSGRLTENRCVIEVALPLATTLSQLHALGIVHRDVKPEHIICSYGTTRLVDFCEAADKRLQCLNHRAGQLEYMAPEVLTKPRAEEIFHEVLYNGMSEEELPQYNEKADVWSLGVVLYEALTGMQPFIADNVTQMIAEQRRLLTALQPDGTPTFIAQHKLSQQAQLFLMAALNLDPAKRISAEALIHHPWITMYTSQQQNQWLLTPTAAAEAKMVHQSSLCGVSPAKSAMSPLVAAGSMHLPVR